MRTDSLRNAVSERWIYALLGASVSVPLTTLGYWQTGSELSLSPVLLGGLIAGYFSKRNTGDRSGVGVRTGLLGVVPVLWMVADILAATSALTGPVWFRVAGVALVIGLSLTLVTVTAGLGAAAGAIGARVGGWLAGSGGRNHPPAAGN
ncbi:DUF5518 domain-containing protein [Halogeometricum borinquense]|uniref:DUF5518 domain-containing protein n=1 Tax=Halogeometricum borinquense (strain ATCC 700274 / DSM 11551 / JCM 10706 / KCTC 4070 / PR3) TaxID=469382 RepID=E4NLW3_HALBP|nr:DUF5518 domain-containing protein [Halogeometricum borinquense]ADQ68413.1 hypothetical protein Hbor_28720 [Halogeometricum borinquense DSM 11551]ELY31375.1 hypothetical protein C499_01265 [Halogeometricum borinquense DSM 11551]QIQ77580.1 DUF5518 domain-containing protein [Halogeometricum borinquense]